MKLVREIVYGRSHKSNLWFIPSLWVGNCDGFTEFVFMFLGRQLIIDINNRYAKDGFIHRYRGFDIINRKDGDEDAFLWVHNIWGFFILPRVNYSRIECTGGYVSKHMSISFLKFCIDHTSDKIRKEAK